MKDIEIREFLGDYALDIPIGDSSVNTIFFNSRRNAETVKRIMEVDDSIPNASTVCDMVEVVRCKDCMYWGGAAQGFACNKWSGLDFKRYTAPRDFCSEGVKHDGKSGIS